MGIKSCTDQTSVVLEGCSVVEFVLVAFWLASPELNMEW